MEIYTHNVSHSFIRKLANEYLSDSMSMSILANCYNTCPAKISNILFKGVSERILDDVTSHAIVNKVCLLTHNKAITKKRWKLALEIRQLPMLNLKVVTLSQKIQQLNFQIDSYDSYFAEVEGAPSKEYLRSHLKELEQDLQKTKNTILSLKKELKNVS